MKGDFSKNTFNAKKHYKDVNMQQGRVLLDTDWNEQNEITDHRIETETVDTIGQAGAPLKVASGFEIIPVNTPGSPPLSPVNPGNAIEISAGRFYVDGILCENESPVLFTNQPDLTKTPLPSQPGNAGTYLFYLDAWQRHITALEDPEIREVALGGPDTTTRTKTIWQVGCVNINTSPINCLTELPASVLNLSTGRINARTTPSSGGQDACGLVTSGGYTGLANQLYRVEIHKPGNKNAATFKWSRDNGSVVAKWDKQDNADHNKLIIKSPGRDELLGFKSGDYIELIDDNTDLLQQPGILVQIANVEGTVITVNPATIKRPDGSIGGTTPLIGVYTNPRIRRWDSPGGEIQLNTTDTSLFTIDNGVKWIKLEDGIEVEFKTGEYKNGDYWLIPARTFESTIEWPWPVTDPQSPKGIKHHFAKLAICTLSFPSPGNTPRWTRISDCRPLFPPLTELTSLFYVGGDGQEGIPGAQLPQPLMVGVSNGQWPVQNAKIKFTLATPGIGTLDPANGIAFTGPDGKAVCKWTPGAEGTPQSQTVEAHLLDAADVSKHLPVIFNAKLLPLTMFYVGGDGQEAAPGAKVNYPLKVGVAYENTPANGINVEFKVTAGTGKLDNGGTDVSSIIVKTVNGVAECPSWKLGSEDKQQVTATLLDAGNAQKSNVQIIFSATPVVASGKGKCTYTVGKNGDFATLDIAVEKLREEKNICLCLMAPVTENEHTIENLKIDEKLSIKITGCGATIRMKGEQFLLSANTITLQGITVQASLASAEIILRGRDVNADHCTFGRRNDGDDGVFITIDSGKKITTLKWFSNKVGGGSLGLTTGVKGWINDNFLQGNIIINHEPGFPMSWAISDSQRKLIEGKLQSTLTIIHNATTLHVSGNVLNKVVTMTPVDKIQDILLQGAPLSLMGYQNISVTRNIFNGIASSFLAELITISDNHFLNTKRVTVAAFALGYCCSVTGNIDPLFNGDDGAIIDTIISRGRKIPAPNLIMVK